MICYRDMTFCYSDCKNTECRRFISEEVKEQSNKFGLLVAQADFSKQCKDYKP